MSYVYLALAVAFNVGSYAAFKEISTRPQGALWLGLFAVGLALGTVNAVCFNLALRELRLAVAYPVFSGASISAVVLVSVVFFGERIGLSNIVGSALVLAGIVLLTR